jgi:hypothetical protein
LAISGKCETPSVLQSLEEWTRRRLRSALWKQWPRGSVRFAELRKRGVNKDLAGDCNGNCVIGGADYTAAASSGLRRSTNMTAS